VTEVAGLKLELLTRPGCHLCEEMAEVLEKVLPKYDLTYIALDIDQDPDLKRRFTDVIPVLLRNGKPVAKTRLDSRQLERILRRRRFFGG